MFFQESLLQSSEIEQSTVQRLSAMDTPLVARDAKNLYFQYCFIKSSNQYFIYTLRRLLI